MTEWWNQLEPLTKAFYGGAAFFSVILFWQLISMFLGLDHEGADDVSGADVDSGGLDHTYDHFEHGADADAVDSNVAFKLLSFRAITAFFTLFTWGTALTLSSSENKNLGSAMGYGSIWGLAGMLSVALLIYSLKKLAETGNVVLATCVGKDGTVYLNIPSDGFGEVRVPVSGVVSFIKARGKDGAELKANTPVRVTKQLSANSVEVEKV